MHPVIGITKTERLLSPLGNIYAFCARIHSGIRRARAVQMPVPVISVGNISMGGTGKTPVCALLAEYFSAEGRKPVILTRGYKSRPKALPHLVDVRDNPVECGDEPLLLARMLINKAKVVVDPRRVRAARWAMTNLDPGLFILDDGFQHVGIKRTTDLVLLTAHDLEAGWNRVFPAGCWREGEQALQRADIFLINIWGRDIRDMQYLVNRQPVLSRQMVFFMDIQVQGLRAVHCGEQVQSIDQRPYILATGVANHNKVVSSVHRFLGYSPHSHLPFPDHHDFGPESVKAIMALARESGAQDIICTSKDAVKLGPVPGFRVWEMITCITIFHGQDAFFRAVSPF